LHAGFSSREGLDWQPTRLDSDAICEMDDLVVPVVCPLITEVASEDNSRLANGGTALGSNAGNLSVDKLYPLQPNMHRPEELVRARKLEQTLRCAVGNVVHGWLQARAQLQALEGPGQAVKWAEAAVSAEQLLASLPQSNSIGDLDS
jgi:hypothetical protein